MKTKRKNAIQRRGVEAGQLDLFGADQMTKSGGSRHQKLSSKEAPKAIANRVAIKNPTEAQKELLATKEAARKLGIGISTLEKMRAQRRGPPFVRLGGSIVRYRLADLEAWVSKHTR